MSKDSRPGLVTRTYTVSGISGYGVIALFGILMVSVTFVSGGRGPIGIVIAALILVITAVMVVRAIRQNSLVKHRSGALMQFAAANGLQYEPMGGNLGDADFKNLSLLSLSGVREPDFVNFIAGNGWKYSELQYKVYRRTKYGEYHAETAYYGIMSMELPRQLPNIFFDSKKERGRQFRFHFAGSQLHSLEGDFDNYFATYFPPDYSIDGLAIITPDTMQTLKEAADYDIELQGNQVYLMGPLYQVDQQIPDMATKLQAIHKQLLDNIMTYRDERLPYQVGRQMVTPLGASLKRSKTLTYATYIAVVVYVLLRVIEAVFSD